MLINKKHINCLRFGMILFGALFFHIPSYAQWSREKPHTRWWWMDNAVDSLGIVTQLDAFGNAGFGGVEIVPIYGVKDSKYKPISFLSKEWLDMIKLTINEGKKRGIEVYLAAGAGWPLGGPSVSLKDAASFLKVKTIIQSSTNDVNIGTEEELNSDSSKVLAIVAYKRNIKTILKDYQIKDKQYRVSGDYDSIVIAIEKKTFQKVKRASIGGAGFTLDHFSHTAVADYLQNFYKNIETFSSDLGAVYNDSYEVYGANWTQSFFADFQKRKNYDLRLFLPYLISNENKDSVKRIKNDYRDVLSQLMTENFAKQFTAFAHNKGTKSLNQAHGSPANLLDLYANTDIAEGETFGSSNFAIPGLRRDSSSVLNVDPDPNMLRFAASAAHTQNHPLVSCELFTWLTDHFKTSFALCKPEVEQVFLSGVNSVVYHGSNYSPATASWPGWLFYASVDFTPSNSLWPMMGTFNKYVTNCQRLLQGGLPANDLAVYWPIYDLWDDSHGLDMPLRVHNIDEWLHPTSFNKTIVELEKKGYSFDFVSDLTLSKSSIVNNQLTTDVNSQIKFKSLIVPACDNIPMGTFQKILHLASNGLTVYFEKMPLSVPGLSQLKVENKKLHLLIEKLQWKTVNGNKIAALGKGRIIVSNSIPTILNKNNIKGESIVNLGLKYIKRKYKDGMLYYIVNHTSKDIDKNIELTAQGRYFSFYDPLTEMQGKVMSFLNNNRISTRIQLKSGQAIFIKVRNAVEGSLLDWSYIEKVYAPIAFDTKWKLHFINGGPSIPKDTIIDTSQLWTNLGDSTMNNFSGTATYTASFNLDIKRGLDYKLHISDLYETAEIYINGKKAGSIWSLPQELLIGKYLKDGNNEIQIKVSNLMANRIRYMDRTKLPWKIFKDINIVDIKYKPFGASNWNISPSGISGVSILPISLSK